MANQPTTAGASNETIKKPARKRRPIFVLRKKYSLISAVSILLLLIFRIRSRSFGPSNRATLFQGGDHNVVRFVEFLNSFVLQLLRHGIKINSNLGQAIQRGLRPVQ